MKKIIFTVMLLAVMIVNTWNLNAESKLDPLQEVEASGEGINENDAFKQAVVDAVRQVTGTLVTSETLIQEENVIKEEVLSLSNGFVEKVLEQKKTKNSDGTWTVKLKCIVRKGKVYEKLREVDVPTIKFDGTSLFADVISQVENEKDAAKILEKALKNYSPMKLITTKMIGDRPEIVEKNENTTTLKIKWEAVWNQEEFSRTVVPPLVDILEKIKLSEKEASAIKSGRGDFGTLDFSIWTKDCGSFDFSIWQKKRLKYYIIDKNIVDRIPLNYYDSCVPGRLRFILLLLDNNDNLISYLGNNDKPISYIELLYYETYQSPFECWIIPGFFVKKTEKFTNRLINEKVFSIPTQLLPKIASIRILVGNQIGHEKIDQTNSEYHPDEGSICFATFKPYTENKFKGNCFLKCIGKDHSTHRSIYELYEASDDIMKELKREKFSGESFGEFFYPLGGEFEFLPWKKE